MSDEQTLDELREKVSAEVKSGCQEATRLWEEGDAEAAQDALFKLWFGRSMTMLQSGDPFRLQDAEMFNSAASVIEPNMVITPMDEAIIEKLKALKQEIEGGNRLFPMIQVAGIKMAREKSMREQEFDPLDCFAEAAYDEVVEAIRNLSA